MESVNLNEQQFEQKQLQLFQIIGQLKDMELDRLIAFLYMHETFSRMMEDPTFREREKAFTCTLKLAERATEFLVEAQEVLAKYRIGGDFNEEV